MLTGASEIKLQILGMNKMFKRECSRNLNLSTYLGIDEEAQLSFIVLFLWPASSVWIQKNPVCSLSSSAFLWALCSCSQSAIV